MGAGDLIDLALDYGYIVFGGLFVFLFSNVGAGILRAEGDVNRAIYALAITAVLNIILDPIFIYTLNMGIMGVWYGLCVGGVIGVIINYLWAKLYMNKLIKIYPTDTGLKKSLS